MQVVYRELPHSHHVISIPVTLMPFKPNRKDAVIVV